MKHQMVFLLAGGITIKSIPINLDEHSQMRDNLVKLMESAAAGKLNYMNLQRDTGTLLILSQETLRTMVYCELVEVPEPQVSAWQE